MSKLKQMAEMLKGKDLSIENMMKAEFEIIKNNKNNMSYWLNCVKNCGIAIPKTLIIPITFELYCELNRDTYSDSFRSEFSTMIKDIVTDSNLDENGHLFVKTGVYSGKFSFDYCNVKENSADFIGEHLLNVYYDGLIVGAGHGKELVIREFIENSNKLPTIYNGMPLNTEFRVFYDFTNKKVLGMFNYWDRETMIKGLNKKWYAQDLETFKGYIDTLEDDYYNHKDSAIELVSEAMGKVNGIDGIWSIDLMLVDENYWLIDMAIGGESYYYDKIELDEDSNEFISRATDN